MGGNSKHKDKDKVNKLILNIISKVVNIDNLSTNVYNVDDSKLEN
jgi:hypothetical protein